MTQEQLVALLESQKGTLQGAAATAAGPIAGNLPLRMDLDVVIDFPKPPTLTDVKWSHIVVLHVF